MRIIIGSNNIKGRLKHPVVTLGNFDGVHIGHQKVLEKVIECARKPNPTSLIYTYDPHPAKVLAPQLGLQTLSTLDQKLRSIEAAGIDVCVVENFTHDFAKMTSQEFLTRVILRRLNPSFVVVGYDFTFGRHRSGTVSELKDFCKRHGIVFKIVRPVFLNGMLVSSTEIRRCVTRGDLKLAGRMLGRPYAIVGTIKKGRGIGKELGFHTANIDVENEIIPPQGVWITKCVVGKGRPRLSLTNIGHNPTFGGEELSIESHILGFKGDICGRRMEILFYKYLRPEKVFDDPRALSEQIRRDIKQIQSSKFKVQNFI